MKKFFIEVFAEGNGHRFLVGSGVYSCKSEKEAKEKALEASWEPRLEAGGMSPVCEVSVD